jgi:hypothetical protein
LSERYFTEWAMTLFCRGFSFELVTRVFDIFLLEGDYKIVYRVSLAILKVSVVVLLVVLLFLSSSFSFSFLFFLPILSQTFEAEFLAMRFDKIMSFLREIPTRIDAPTVMDVSLLFFFVSLFRRSYYFPVIWFLFSQVCWRIPLRRTEIAFYEEEVSEFFSFSFSFSIF